VTPDGAPTERADAALVAGRRGRFSSCPVLSEQPIDLFDDHVRTVDLDEVTRVVDGHEAC
jgi:hypothetical protein